MILECIADQHRRHRKESENGEPIHKIPGTLQKPRAAFLRSDGDINEE
jgi:hypothetical protein